MESRCLNLLNAAKSDISVIIPSYNHESFIKIAIQSVLDQTYRDFELLIADDGSVDGSWEIIKSFKDTRITSYRFDTNMGAAETVNFLIGKAEGKYIALLNSDDYWHKDKLESQYYFLEQNPDYSACFTNARIVDEKGLSLQENQTQWINIFKSCNSSRGEWLHKFFFEINNLCHPSVMIRKQTLELTGLYNPCFKQLPDFDMWIKLLKHSSIYVLDDYLTYFRVLPNAKNTSSATFENVSRFNLELELIMESFFDELPEDVFIQGFSQHFMKKSDLTSIELECEKTFLYFNAKGKLKDIYTAVGIRRLYRQLSSEKTAKILAETYGYLHKNFREYRYNKRFFIAKYIASIKYYLTRSRFFSKLIYMIKHKNKM